MILQILVMIYILSILGGAYYLLRSKFPDRMDLDQPHNKPLVSIIIPARNEERNIGRCLDSLLGLEYKHKEIIVVDGNSDDQTPAIVSSYPEVILIEEPNHPPGWIGKPWACYNGYKQASGDVLLFTDADTWHDPRSLSATLAQLETSDGFLSFLTTQEFRSFWEHMLAIVFLIISISVRGTRGTSKATIANGQYMLFTRTRYEQLGTHEQVSDSIIEDLAFASFAAEQGYPPVIPFHRNLVTARMYTNLSEIREGFGKNLALGVNQTGFDSVIGAGFMTIWALGWLLILVIGQVTTGLVAFHIALILGGAISFMILLAVIEYRVSTSSSLFVIFYPIYYVVFLYIVVSSMVMTYFRKEITWKGRNYAIQ